MCKFGGATWLKTEWKDVFIIEKSLMEGPDRGRRREEDGGFRRPVGLDFPLILLVPCIWAR